MKYEGIGKYTGGKRYLQQMCNRCILAVKTGLECGPTQLDLSEFQSLKIRRLMKVFEAPKLLKSWSGTV